MNGVMVAVGEVGEGRLVEEGCVVRVGVAVNNGVGVIAPSLVKM